MSQETKRRFLILLTLVVIAGALSFTVAAVSKAVPREIVLVTIDNTFFLEGESTPNPTLELAPGETVRLRLINRDPGMKHDWAVEAWRTGTRLISEGSSTAMVFTVPSEPGSYEYFCSTHALLMKGRLEVR